MQTGADTDPQRPEPTSTDRPTGRTHSVGHRRASPSYTVGPSYVTGRFDRPWPKHGAGTVAERWRTPLVRWYVEYIIDKMVTSRVHRLPTAA